MELLEIQQQAIIVKSIGLTLNPGLIFQIKAMKSTYFIINIYYGYLWTWTGYKFDI